MAGQFNHLENVKKALGITGDFQDSTLEPWIDDVKRYLIAAGVELETVDSEKASGAVSRGVADLWDNGSGKGQLSPYFYERAIQLTG